MNKNLHDIDKIFKDGLEDHLEAAPRGVWDAVNNDLDKKQAFHFKEKYYRLKRMALVLLLFVFSSIAALLYFGSAGTSKNTLLVKDQNAAVAPVGSTVYDSSVTKTNDLKRSAENKNESIKNPAATKDIAGRTNEKIETESLATDKMQNKTRKQSAKAAVVFERTTDPENKRIVSNNEPANKESTLTTGNSNKTISKRKIKEAATGTSVNEIASNEKATAKQLQGLNQKKLAFNSHKKLRAGASNKIENNFAPEKIIADNDYQSENSQQVAAKHQKKIKSTVANKTNTISPLNAYLYQSPLLLSAIEQPAPGPFKAIDQAPFLNSVQQNDSIKNVVAIAVMRTVSHHSISLMPFVAPNHSFTRLEDNSQFAGPGRNKNAAEREERQGTSFSAGVLVNYGLTKSIIVQSGVVFSSAKTNISPKTIYARPDNNGHARYEFNCASGYSYINPKTGASPTVGDSIKAMGSSSAISYIGVPVSLIYVWQKGRLLLKPGIGVSVNFLTSGKSTTSFNNTGGNQKEIAAISGLKNSYVDASIGFGTELMLNRNISIGVKPVLRMALTSINKDTPVKAYQNFLSLETGIKINL